MSYNRKARLRAALASVAAATAIAALAGCSTSEDPTGAPTTNGSNALDLSGVTLTLGQNDATVGSLFQASGILDDLPYKVEFASFPDQVQSAAALVSGDTDGSVTAQYTVVQAVAASKPQWTKDTIPYVTVLSTKRISQDVADWVGTVSSPTSGITELTADTVRGKKWTTSPGATNFLTMLQTLDYLGVGFDEIEWVPLSNADGALALLNNQVDLASGGFSSYTDSVAAGGTNLLSGADVGPGSPGGLVVSTASLKDPLKAAAIKDFVAKFIDFYYWKLTNPEAVQQVLVTEQKLTPEAAAASWQLFHRALPTPIDDNLKQVTSQITDLAYKAGAIDTLAPVDVQFDDRFTDVINDEIKRVGFQAAIDKSIDTYDK